MADRRVTRTRKDPDGDITALCNPAEHWSPRSKTNAIWDIEHGVHSYYVLGSSRRVEIRVVNGPRGRYLRTDPDVTGKNNLDELPDC